MVADAARNPDNAAAGWRIVSRAREIHDEIARKNAAALAAAEREAIAEGKEPFDLARFEVLYGHGSMAQREERLRFMYYVNYRELKTLAELAARLHENEPWEDSS